MIGQGRDREEEMEEAKGTDNAKEEESAEQAEERDEKEEEEREELKPSEDDEKDKKIQELLSTLQYLQAEYENYKKRTAKDIENIIKYSNEEFISKLLPILDDFESSLKSIKDEKIFKGINLIYNKLVECLRTEGLEAVKAMGENFDPYKHEAVLEINDPERNENEIVEVVQKGYLFKSKVIRPSKVKVVKHHVKENDRGETNG